jgi:hypothetical protein
VELYEVMRTTPATRAFTAEAMPGCAEAVPDAVVHRILDHARFAPSGGNRQGWQARTVCKLRRQPVEQFTTVDRFDGPGFDPDRP